MSANILKDRIVARLDGQIDEMVRQAVDIRSTRGIVTGGASTGVRMTVPPRTFEDIAMTILEINAFRRGLDRARELVVEEHQLFVDPESLKIGSSEEEKGEGSFY